ncbi:gfo/Idh/MocA family oxidoreductase [bacterium]|nr:gfo/Idh/MocA family oxidoreductase [bacterium]
MSHQRYRVALVGCGQIADAHLQQIRRISCAELVAVCDLEPLLARQAAERFDVPTQFTDFDQMLGEAAPDILHVTTPVHTHASLACRALQAGVHVYVEKPFAVDLAEARRIVATAQKNNRLVCLGHDQLFDPAWRQCVELVSSGTIGDVQHVDSYLAYPLQGPFGRQVLQDHNHWVRRLPGGLFQNTMSHPLYRITEFLTDESPAIQAEWFSRNIEHDLPTELRLNLRGRSVTGTLTFTSSTRPCRRVTRVFGTQGSLEVDLDTQLCRIDRGERFPGAFAKLEAPIRDVVTSLRNLARNTARFWRAEFHYFAGMYELFQRFYAAIDAGEAAPVSDRESLRVTAIMDEVFATCRQNDYLSNSADDGDDGRVVLNLIRETGELVADACRSSHSPVGRPS